MSCWVLKFEVIDPGKSWKSHWILFLRKLGKPASHMMIWYLFLHLAVLAVKRELLTVILWYSQSLSWGWRTNRPQWLCTCQVRRSATLVTCVPSQTVATDIHSSLFCIATFHKSFLTRHFILEIHDKEAGSHILRWQVKEKSKERVQARAELFFLSPGAKDTSAAFQYMETCCKLTVSSLNLRVTMDWEIQIL